MSLILFLCSQILSLLSQILFFSLTNLLCHKSYLFCHKCYVFCHKSYLCVCYKRPLCGYRTYLSSLCYWWAAHESTDMKRKDRERREREQEWNDQTWRITIYQWRNTISEIKTCILHVIKGNILKSNEILLTNLTRNCVEKKPRRTEKCEKRVELNLCWGVLSSRETPPWGVAVPAQWERDTAGEREGL